jgi:hypothetical protein
MVLLVDGPTLAPCLRNRRQLCSSILASRFLQFLRTLKVV